ncbi:hypothetical protein BCR44DRAFT_1231223 [Catenaria anguillulae PL171]|uniref:Uncharacterized protein n=1 Tax=Catenaria anguillulae PL171 TaxID=765915 RepID=A0A1Y2HF91_9FUNG|nr:hypothetical protein BCR44DRAFT_1231223 [Catenaria anguillulae PL171]
MPSSQLPPAREKPSPRSPGAGSWRRRHDGPANTSASDPASSGNHASESPRHPTDWQTAASQESRKPLWVSPAIPDWLMGRLIGPKGTHVLGLQRAFHPMCVRLVPIKDDAHGRRALIMFPSNKRRQPNPATVEKLVAQFKCLLTEVLNVPRCPMPRNLTYSVVETDMDTLLEWRCCRNHGRVDVRIGL